MLELTIDNQTIKLNKPEELPTYLEIAERLGHQTAQLFISLQIEKPFELIDNDTVWFKLTNDSILSVNALLSSTGDHSLSNILRLMASPRTGRQKELLDQFIEKLELLYLREPMIDYERTLRSFAAPITEDTIIYLNSVDLNLLAIPIKALNMIQIIEEDA